MPSLNIAGAIDFTFIADQTPFTGKFQSGGIQLTDNANARVEFGIDQTPSRTSGTISVDDTSRPPQFKLKVAGSDVLVAEAGGVQISNLLLDGRILRPRPSSSQSTVISLIDYSLTSPSQLLAPITILGGVNRVYGQVERYQADIDILAGRVVALADYNDNATNLRVTYLVAGEERNPSIYPIGITQNDCLAGQTVDVCVMGYTTAISANADTTPERGSLVNTTGSGGLVLVNSTGTINEGRIGYMAQGSPVLANGPVLVYVGPWYQPY
jgi:hypothetical protein